MQDAGYVPGVVLGQGQDNAASVPAVHPAQSCGDVLQVLGLFHADPPAFRAGRVTGRVSGQPVHGQHCQRRSRYREEQTIHAGLPVADLADHCQRTVHCPWLVQAGISGQQSRAGRAGIAPAEVTGGDLGTEPAGQLMSRERGPGMPGNAFAKPLVRGLVVHAPVKPLLGREPAEPPGELLRRQICPLQKHTQSSARAVIIQFGFGYLSGVADRHRYLADLSARGLATRLAQPARRS